MSATTEISEQELLPLLLLDYDQDETLSGITRFQKLVFLAQEGGLEDDPMPALKEEESNYEFVPHNYGPFSKELSETLDRLYNKRLIDKEKAQTKAGNTRYEYQLTPDGKDKLSENEEKFHRVGRKILKGIQIRYGEMPIFELLDKVYAEYPEYTKNSKIA